MSMQFYCILNAYRRAVQAINSDAFDNLEQFWKERDIKNFMAWDDVNTCSTNACWDCFWPEIMNDCKGFTTNEKEDGCHLECCAV